MSTKKPQSFMLNLLNGSALGIIVALVPGALLSELFKAISTAIPEVQIVIPLLTATNSLVGIQLELQSVFSLLSHLLKQYPSVLQPC